jgi:hypothetical protein
MTATATEVLDHVRSQGVQVWIEGTRILYSPKNAAQELLDSLRQHKSGIIGLLSGTRFDASSPPSFACHEGHRAWKRAQPPSTAWICATCLTDPRLAPRDIEALRIWSTFRRQIT